MSNNVLRSRIQEDMKDSMRNRDQNTLGTIRLLLAAIKQKEIDERITLGDAEIYSVLDKMIKQRQDSIEHYKTGNRPDLIAQEAAEIEILKKYMPKPLTEIEIEDLIKEAILETKPTSIKDMAKVMAFIKSKAQGRADMGKISSLIKSKLE